MKPIKRDYILKTWICSMRELRVWGFLEYGRVAYQILKIDTFTNI